MNLKELLGSYHTDGACALWRCFPALAPLSVRPPDPYVHLIRWSALVGVCHLKESISLPTECFKGPQDDKSDGSTFLCVCLIEQLSQQFKDDFLFIIIHSHRHIWNIAPRVLQATFWQDQFWGLHNHIIWRYSPALYIDITNKYVQL